MRVVFVSVFDDGFGAFVGVAVFAEVRAGGVGAYVIPRRQAQPCLAWWVLMFGIFSLRLKAFSNFSFVMQPLVSMPIFARPGSSRQEETWMPCCSPIFAILSAMLYWISLLTLSASGKFLMVFL